MIYNCQAQWSKFKADHGKVKSTIQLDILNQMQVKHSLVVDSHRQF